MGDDRAVTIRYAGAVVLVPFSPPSLASAAELLEITVQRVLAPDLLM